MSETLELLRKLWNSPSSRRAWTPEMRAAQAQRCRQSQPWVHSTGPRSQSGKAISSLNGRASSNKRSAKQFDILASLLMEIERLKHENVQLKAKVVESYEVSGELNINETNL